MRCSYPDYNSFESVYKKQTLDNRKIIDAFIEYCRISAGDSSIKKIFGKIVQICDIFNKNLNEITLEDLRKFLALLNNSGRATETSNDIKKILKRFLKWKFKDWNKRFNGLEDIKQKRKTTSEKLSKEDLLTPEEIEILLKSAQDLRYKVLIILLFESAGRPEEILKLRWKDINLDEKEIKLNSGKTGGVRILPIDKSVNRLFLYKQEYPFGTPLAEDYLFPNPKNRKEHLTNQTISDYLKHLGKNTINKRIFPYLFRHTRLNSIRKKLSPDVYEKFAGHSIEVALDSYSHIDNEDVRSEMFEKIYNIEQLTKEDKEELKKIKKDLAELREDFDMQTEWIKKHMTPKEVNNAVQLLRKLIEVR